MSEDIKPYNEDYTNGYKAGFGDGWDAAKQTFEKHLKDVADSVPYQKGVYQRESTYTVNEGCPVCGIGKNSEPLGYACQHPSCPTRISFSNIMDNTQ